MRSAFDSSGAIYASMTDGSNTGFTWTSHEYGAMHTFAGGGDVPYNTSTGVYDGINMNNGTFNGLVYTSQIDSVTSTVYAGEYLEVIMPFYIEPTSMILNSFNGSYTPDLSHLMASDDGGATYQLIETFTSQAQLLTVTYTGNIKYNAFKYIVSTTKVGATVMALSRWGMFGKIYTLDI
jgi:hypothetical protein